MNGITATAGCSTVAALCRRPSGSTGATKDLVALLPNTAAGNDWRSWLTSESVDDQMWLYEWKGTPALPTSTATPQTYVVSKAIGGGWEYGHQNVVIGDTHYGISMKSTTGKDSGGTQHQGDSYVVVSRTTPAIDMTRGWRWVCGPGHTLSNRPAFSGGRFAALCTTDWNNQVGTASNGGIWMHVENKPSVLVRSIYNSTVNALRYNGEATSLLPRADGGFIGVIVGSDNPAIAQSTKIGLVRFSSDGLLESTMWVANSSTHFSSYPQLVSLGSDTTGTTRYLLGWGQMMPTATSTFDNFSPDLTQRFATKYFVKKISHFGADRMPALEIVNGWVEQDQMMSLGTGIVGWVYVTNPRCRLPLPTVNSTSLQ